MLPVTSGFYWLRVVRFSNLWLNQIILLIFLFWSASFAKYFYLVMKLYFVVLCFFLKKIAQSDVRTFYLFTLVFIIKKWADPGLFFIYFRLFKHTLQSLRQIGM